MPENKLAKLGLELPHKKEKGGNYELAVRSGNLLFLSGNLSYDHIGKLGEDFSVEEGYEASRQAALQALATIHQEAGSLSNVRKFVKILAFINCTMDFKDHAKVMNGCSDLIVSVFGNEIGGHARTTIGAILPRGAAVELEMVVELKG